MAKRGRPSKKTVKKRKQTKQKSKLLLLFAILIIIGFLVLEYFLQFK